MAAKIVKLVMECRGTPFRGTGKPEPLKHQFAGCWSRRIDQEHRLVYRVENQALVILSCRFHYN
ncbi:MAG: Txe/YoeB family addiction module toxin [Verrucomicrobiaceae bacterium]